jgi:hypothetical protein
MTHCCGTCEQPPIRFAALDGSLPQGKADRNKNAPEGKNIFAFKGKP